MFENLVAGLDGSACSARALDEGWKGETMISTLRDQIEVKCPHHYLIRHAERYFTVLRRGQTPGTFTLTVDTPKVGLPGKVQARHDVRIHYELSQGADGYGVINLTWEPDDRFVPRYTGVLSGEILEDGSSRLTLAGKYHPPLGPLGALFDAILGRRIAAATAHTFLADIKQFIESDYQILASTGLASSPKD
ncbi:MAG: hypothetical protein WA742_12150 [Candidatus Cybelea sp.]|jgi:hypothetical protein